MPRRTGVRAIDVEIEGGPLADFARQVTDDLMVHIRTALGMVAMGKPVRGVHPVAGLVVRHVRGQKGLSLRQVATVAYGRLLSERLKARLRWGPPVLRARRLPLEYQWIKDKLTPDALRSAVEKFDAAAIDTQEVGKPEAEPGTTPNYNQIRFRLHKVKCLNETNPEWGGDDEIDLSSTGIDSRGKRHEGSRLDVRDDFEEDIFKNYSPPKTLLSFDIPPGGKWPKVFIAVVHLAEIDGGGFGSFINDFYDLIKEEVTSLLARAGAAAGTALGGPAGAAVGAIVGWVVAEVLDWLTDVLEDDVFASKTTAAMLESASDNFDGHRSSPNFKLTFKGFGGKYKVTYDWKLYT